MAYLVAALIATVVAAFEQAMQFERRAFPWRRRAIKWWLLRIGTEVFAACIVLALAQAAGVCNADKPLAGVVAAAVATMGLRSTIVDLPDEAYGARERFDRWRHWITARLRTTVAVAVTERLADEVVPTLRAANMPIGAIGERIEIFIRNDENLSPSQRETELAFVKDTVSDDASDEYERLLALIDRANQLGGDELLQSLVDAAERSE